MTPSASTPEQDAWMLAVFGVDLRQQDAPGLGGAGPDGPVGQPRPKQPTRSARLRAHRPPQPPRPVPRAALGPAQRTRADAMLARMTPADRQRVEALLSQAKGEARSYLVKAIASRHGAGELEAFMRQVSGKDHTWMEDHLHLVGDTSGRGIRQQWQSSCGPAMEEALRGELDPIYALAMRRASPKLDQVNERDGMAVSPKLAADQKRILLKGGGTATPRTKTGGDIDNFITALMEQIPSNGLVFKPVHVETDTAGKPTAKGADKALALIDAALKDGLPVPLRISSPGYDGGHALLCTGMDPGPPRRYSVHDPWAGKTYVLPEHDIRGNTFSILGWNQVTTVFEPIPFESLPPLNAPAKAPGPRK